MSLLPLRDRIDSLITIELPLLEETDIKFASLEEDLLEGHAPIRIGLLTFYWLHKRNGIKDLLQDQLGYFVLAFVTSPSRKESLWDVRNYSYRSYHPDLLEESLAIHVLRKPNKEVVS